MPENPQDKPERQSITDDVLLRYAIENGYFDSPKRIGIREIGKHFGLGKSGISHRLFRMEGLMMREWLKQNKPFVSMQPFQYSAGFGISHTDLEDLDQWVKHTKATRPLFLKIKVARLLNAYHEACLRVHLKERTPPPPQFP